jgi:V8-like Glu-specific endopeptidase
MESLYTADGVADASKPHQSVTNEAPAEATVKAEVQPGTTGQGDVNSLAGEREHAEGYRPVEEMAGFTESVPGAGLLVEAPSLAGLRDIGEASFGAPAGAEAIIGVDDRVRISPASAYPWRAIASLLITAADNSQWIGTGWFVSPRTLITAGHCVFIKGSGVPGRDGWVKRITVIPGRDASAMPYGSAQSTSFRSVSGWTGSGNNEFDYGAIILPVPMGGTVGTFGYASYPDAQLMGQTINVSGYPGDKPAGTHWFHANRVSATGPRKLWYLADTMGGQSGAPVWRIIDGKRIAVAIHAYGGATANHGTRINGEVIGNINGWRA